MYQPGFETGFLIIWSPDFKFQKRSIYIIDQNYDSRFDQNYFFKKYFFFFFTIRLSHYQL
jgi:hypothetical protein